MHGLDASLAIAPNDHGDWLNQRREDFQTFLSVGERGVGSGVFARFGPGMQTNRDAWVYNSSQSTLANSMTHTIHAYNAEVARWQSSGESGDDQTAARFVSNDPTRVSWSRSLRAFLRRGATSSYSPEAVALAQYRPFQTQFFYQDRVWNHEPGGVPATFPSGAANLCIYLTGPSAAMPFTALVLANLPDQATYGAQSNGQLFARWRYETAAEDGVLDFGTESEAVEGYRRIDNITDEALKRFTAAYGSITKDDIFFYVYGLLHSPEYRETYAADMKKMLPRIPLVEDPWPFVQAGRDLSDLHLGYESVTPYPLVGLDTQPPAGADPYDFYRVEKMAFAKVRDAETKKLVADRTTVKYNSRITLSGIPEAAYRYQLGSRSAVEWILDRYQVKTDKASGIVNDPNDWSKEVSDPRYIINLLARIVTVSLETMTIVDSLPGLEIRVSQ